jgi:hypothetical protein
VHLTRHGIRLPSGYQSSRRQRSLLHLGFPCHRQAGHVASIGPGESQSNSWAGTALTLVRNGRRLKYRQSREDRLNRIEIYNAHCPLRSSVLGLVSKTGRKTPGQSTKEQCSYGDSSIWWQCRYGRRHCIETMLLFTRVTSG